MKRAPALRALTAPIALLFSSLAFAQCIEVQDRDFELSTNNIGSAVVAWKAELKNSCRKTMDADLTIQLLDENAQPVYEMLDKATFDLEEQREVSKEVYVPSRIVDQVEDMAIRVVERERQLN